MREHTVRTSSKDEVDAFASFAMNVRPEPGKSLNPYNS